MKKIEISERIATLLKTTGIAQSEIGRRLGVSPQAVQKWANGGQPRQGKISDIAAAFGITVQEFIRGTVYDSLSSDGQNVNETTNDPVRLVPKRVPISERRPVESGGKLPLISWAQAARWAELMDNFPVEEAEDWIEVPGNNRKNSFCLTIRDESMYNPGGAKSYAQGEVIAVSPAKIPMNRSTVVVLMPGTENAILRQLLTDGDTMMLRALNPAWPNSLVPLGDAEVIGTVTGKWVPED